MYKLIKKNQKKFMAIFAAGLMIAFTLPTFFGQNNTNRGDQAYGYIGNNDFPAQRVQRARDEWAQLKSITIDVFDRERGQPVAQPLPVALLGASAVQQIDNNSEMFALLQEEAVGMGVGVSSDTVKSLLANNKAKFTADADGNPDITTMQAVHGLLLAVGAFDRVAEAAHVSRPLRDHDLAQRQAVAANLVEFNARDYLAKLPAVLDTKDLQAHFDQYKNLEAGSTMSNKWGFGYKVPNKVRVQYIEVDQEKVRAAVEADLSPVEIVKYFKLHPDKFPRVATTAKTLAELHLGHSLSDNQATTQSVTNFFGHAPPLGVAVLLDYDHYRDEVKKALVAERTAELTKQIVGEISTTMTADYVAFSRATAPAAGAAPSTQPADLSTAGPPTSVGPSYGSKEYLEKLALRMQEKYKVLPSVQTIGDLKTAKELAELPGIGKAAFPPDFNVFFPLLQQQNRPAADAYQRLISFPFYATSMIEPLMTEADRANGRSFRVASMAVYQPSAALSGEKGNEYIFRVTEAVAAHPPASLDDIKAQVEADLRIVKAYNLALADAQEFLKSARTKGVIPAADAAHRPFIPTNLFNQFVGDMAMPPDYFLPNPMASRDFISGVYETLRSAAGVDPNHPVGLIELKEQDIARVLVDQIAAVKPSWTTDELPANQLEVHALAIDRTRAMLQAQWFRYDDLAKRMNYRPAGSRKSSAPPPPDQQDQGSDNPYVP